MKKTYNKICKVCGKEFETTKSKKVYCSNECIEKYYKPNNKVIKICKVCGKEFETRSTIKIYCSDACKEEHEKEYLKKYREVHSKHKEKIIKTCIVCGKKFETAGTTKFCSDDCHKKYIRIKLYMYYSKRKKEK
jgi:predicted nucleic acid-binding Zn ribbon protein